ncbi:MAG: VTT domain-containing protein [Desulfobacterales bacterium]|nr:VTT domain-containing protein [Desulfobacterales bacterium]
MINFGIGHFLGERVVRKLVRCETYDKYNQMVQYKGILVIFIFFLIPGFPKDYLCMFLGLTTLPARVFFVLSTDRPDARHPGAEPAGCVHFREKLHVLRDRHRAIPPVRAGLLPCAVMRSIAGLPGTARRRHVTPLP